MITEHPRAMRIHTREQLVELARRLGVRPDWHEPDEQGVTVHVEGVSFDNAGFWPTEDRPFAAPELIETHVAVRRGGETVAYVNLATLFAWASVRLSSADADFDEKMSRFFRRQIVREIRAIATKVRGDTVTPSVGVALAAVVEYVADEISSMTALDGS